MKRSSTHLLLLVTLLALTASCNNSTETTQEEVSTPTDSYDPGPNWKLAWADEFDRDSLDGRNWTYQIEPAGRFNDEWQRYTNSTQNAYINNECLVIKAIHESDAHGMDQYTSARLHTANKHTWTYGKIAARIKLPKGQGIWPAFWMLGANINENGGDTPWPQCGEIDILELYGSKDEAVVEANLHYADSTDSHAMMGAASYKLEEGIFADEFHIFELEWTADQLTWFVDGEAFTSTPLTAEDRSEFHQDFFILLNMAVGGTYAGRPDATTPFPQHMYVDWVRVYQEENA
ncbi:MAG: glycoside hydrolase family 16 protein [Bacteroidota bacterium]